MGVIRCALVLGALAMLPACAEKSGSCGTTDGLAISGLSVTVRNGNGPVCDATVTATDGSYSETLRRNSDCSYNGATERPGTYSVTATAGSATATVTGVRVGGDPCHVSTETVTIDLAP
jgi:hypothetical protein